jgi:hypothetical protein
VEGLLGDRWGLGWAVRVVCVGKLALLLHPVPWAVPSGVALAAAAGAIASARPVVTSRTTSVLLALAMGAAAIATRNTVIRRVAELLGVADAGGSGYGARHEHDLAWNSSGLGGGESEVWALALLVWGLGAMPVATRLHPQWAAARRWTGLLVTAGALVLVIAPPMDHVAVRAELVASLAGEVDTVAVMSSPHLRPAWPRWALLAGCLIAAAAVTRAVPLPRSDVARFACAVASGFAIGVYVAGAFLPPTAAVYALTAAAVTLHALLSMFAHFPTSASHLAMPYLFALAVAMLPATWVAVGFAVGARGGRVGADAAEALDTAHAAVLALHAALCIAASLDIKWTIARLAAASARGRSSARAAGFPASPFGAQRAGLSAVSGASALVRDLDPDRQWMPGVGNAAAVLGFCLAVLLNIAYLGGSETCVFFLAPLLLALSRDPRWLPGLTERRRYFPLVAVTSLALTAGALWAAAGRHMLHRANLLPARAANAAALAAQFSALAAARDLALLAITSATHWHVNRFFWAFERAEGADWLWIALLPLQVLPIVAGGSTALRLLGAIGLAAGATVVYVAKQIKDEGQRFI